MRRDGIVTPALFRVKPFGERTKGLLFWKRDSQQQTVVQSDVPKRLFSRRCSLTCAGM
jgi:hypothetical protein